MLRNVKDLQGYAIRATDGVIGTVEDMYFDDEGWAIRYLVVDTGQLAVWQEGADLSGRDRPSGLDGTVAAGLPHEGPGRKEPRHRHPKPVSRQHEAAYLGYYGTRTTGEAPACGAWARTRGA